MDIRYPMGTFTCEGEISLQQRAIWIQEINELPKKLRETVKGLTEEQLNLPYREGGWMIRQVVHHIADSHMNSYMRFKLALTEDEPTIKPYFEDRWVLLQDSTVADIEYSLSLIDGLHMRWVILLKAMDDTQFKRQFYHPESKQMTQLDYNLGMYAWHGNHHTAHIKMVRDRLKI